MTPYIVIWEDRMGGRSTQLLLSSFTLFSQSIYSSCITLKMSATRSFETLLALYTKMRQSIPEVGNH